MEDDEEQFYQDIDDDGDDNDNDYNDSDFYTNNGLDQEQILNTDSLNKNATYVVLTPEEISQYMFECVKRVWKQLTYLRQ
ncbi:unnamed protein product, partial [Rotaria sp. Silwood2]